MDRERLNEKIFTLLNFQKKIDNEDPDYIFIDTCIKEIPNKKLQDFYFFINTSSEYHSAQGVLLRLKLQKAVNDFMDTVYIEIWEKYNVFEAIDLLRDKIMSLQTALRDLPAQKFEDYFVKVPISKIVYIGAEGERCTLFAEDEIVILKDKGLKFFVEAQIKNGLSLKDEIEKEVKSFYVKKYLQEHNEVKKNLTLTFKKTHEAS